MAENTSATQKLDIPETGSRPEFEPTLGDTGISWKIWKKNNFRTLTVHFLPVMAVKVDQN